MKPSAEPYRISYAQNGEDIVLRRTFSQIDDGFYIDVGANDPEQDSVTKLFYDLGWRGINIEPSREYHRMLSAKRLRDINLSCLAGAVDGEETFYEISETGLSTVRADLLPAHEARGYRTNGKRVPVRSLRSITDEFVAGPVHFLKIDVEGHELEVLRGADWEHHRPWVVLVETTAPLEGSVENPEIVAFLQDKGYRRCLFDGVNSYFVAQEHTELERHLSFPANALDRFHTAGFSRLVAERDGLTDLVREESGRLTGKLNAVRDRLAEVESSLSWRITAPLRVLDGLVRHRRATVKALRERFGSSRERGAVSAPIPELLPALLGSGDPVQVDWAALQYPLRPEPSGARLQSCLCRKSQLESPAFRFWLERIAVPFRVHRKLWEFAFVIQALYERECLVPGAKGLGFAVGEEALPALFASMGCAVTATDLNPDDERAKPWAETAQLASSKEKLCKPEICPAPLFEKLVTYRHVDMNHIPTDLRDFDFTWSSCSFEHCGSIALGLAFVENQMACLKPGGVAVHTTELNLSSESDTLSEGATVIFRRADIEDLVARLRKQGHEVEPLSYGLGQTAEDKFVDIFPYGDEPHLKLLLAEKYVSTSVALIIRRGTRG